MPTSFCVICRTRIPRGSRCKRHALKSPSNREWHRPGAARVRERVLERDGHRCTRCGSSERLEVHHIVPVAKGGPTSLETCVTLCHGCHAEAARS